MLRGESAIGSEAAFHEGLSFVRKRVRQRVASRVTHRQCLAFAFQHKINAPRKVPDAAYRYRAAHADALRPLGAVQVLQFRDRVIVGLALAIPEPSEEPQRNNDNPDSNAKFCLLSHFGHPASPNWLI